jgi:CubicO group peptidase (beta-lactamase class C family)
VAARTLPPQASDCPWPTTAWPVGDLPGGDGAHAARALVDRAMEQPRELGLTLAVVVVHRGRLVLEAYGPDTDADTPLISWSMAKSMVHALAGLAVADGLANPGDDHLLPGWEGDGRAAITLQHLLEMRPGLAFTEDYVDAGVSHVIEMLFGAGRGDVAAYAAALPLEHPPGLHWNYSSGTTNIVSRILGERIDRAGSSVGTYLRERLFDPLGMRSADPRFDAAGTFIGSSFVYATARDFARFGLLYLRDGTWEGRRLLPEGWVDHARTPVPVPPDEPHGYGAHWWLWRDEDGSFAAHGYEGQRTIVVPRRDLVVVRLGKSPVELRPALDAWLLDLIRCFPADVH